MFVYGSTRDYTGARIKGLGFRVLDTLVLIRHGHLVLYSPCCAEDNIWRLG